MAYGDFKEVKHLVENPNDLRAPTTNPSRRDKKKLFMAEHALSKDAKTISTVDVKHMSDKDKKLFYKTRGKYHKKSTKGSGGYTQKTSKGGGTIGTFVNPSGNCLAGQCEP